MATANPATDVCSLADRTRAVFGEAMTMDQVFAAVLDQPSAHTTRYQNQHEVQLLVGSIGYERYKRTDEFMAQLQCARVERLVDVPELPM